MPIKTVNTVKLGVFLMAGLLFLVLLLYMIGKNQHLFGSTYVLKARFENVNGLVPGNNVRVSGIQAGSVKRINFISDTVIEVTMLIDEKMNTIIRQNAVVSIGTDGLVGNKVANITPVRSPAPLAVEGDILASKKSADTDGMLQTLSKTNNDAASIAAELKTMILQINQSKGIWQLLNDESIPDNLKRSGMSIRKATENASQITASLDELVSAVKQGKGSVGALLTDTTLSSELNAAVSRINDVAGQAHTLTMNMNNLISNIDRQLNNQHGTLNALMNDTALTANLKQSMYNIEKATDGLNQNMEALKHNFLFRGYFRKQAKQQNKAKAAAEN